MNERHFKFGRRLFTSSDATAVYVLWFTEESCTLRQFVNEVLAIKREWGYIGISTKNPYDILGDPYVEYSHGELVADNFSEELLDRQINIKANNFASRGWSRMDYLITLEED